MIPRPGRLFRKLSSVPRHLALMLAVSAPALAQEPRVVLPPRLAPASADSSCGPCAPAPLGTFYPTPYLMVRGNWPLGGGYSPLGTYGDMTLTIYGPLSPLRATSAPVNLYSRGYNGMVERRPGTSFSSPNLPALSPVVYPRPGNYYYGPRMDRTPPSWSNGMNWIDQQ